MSLAETIGVPAPVSGPRWNAIVHYNSENGLIDVVHDIEELEEIQALVERGPDWNSIERIEIMLTRRSHETMTIEQSGEL